MANGLPTKIDRYMYDQDFIEVQYRVPLVSDILANRKDAIGVVRFIELPSFEPERLYTLIFTESAIHIEIVVGKTSLWGSFWSLTQAVDGDGTPCIELMEDESLPFVPEDVWRRSTVLHDPSLNCAKPFKSWWQLKKKADLAVSCDSGRDDGISYRHRMCDQHSESFAEWRNPLSSTHPRQANLVQAYVKLLRSAWVYPK